MEILRTVEQLPKTFSLQEIYAQEERLSKIFPNNNFIKDKIRQQLQILRDKNIITFLTKGNYQKND